jgi:hypothetical protein
MSLVFSEATWKTFFLHTEFVIETERMSLQRCFLVNGTTTKQTRLWRNEPILPFFTKSYPFYRLLFDAIKFWEHETEFKRLAALLLVVAMFMMTILKVD